ncbi:tetratricopeptide repeat protein [Neobacillus sp. FSL H8-0543]|uniref:tetratricopeptide repeat protein n=1 Tax=Neobacillus sp. FSL H8-0543 TaxID=2954672 RepID=UPI0031587C46
MTIIAQLKALYEKREYDQALTIVNKEIYRLKNLRFSEFKAELLRIDSVEEFQVMVRLTDHFLMFHISSFITRYAYRRYPNLVTISWYCEELLDQGKLIEADELISNAIAENSEGIHHSEQIERIYFCKLRCLLEMKRVKEAELLLEKIKQSPRPIEDKLGYVYIQLGNRERAREYLTKGMETEEKGRICYLLLADLLAANGELKESLELIEKGEKLYPETPSFQLEKAKRFRDLGMPTKLLEVIQVLNEKIPEHAFVRYFHHLTEIAYYQLADFDRLKAFTHEKKNSLFRMKNQQGMLTKLDINPIIQKSNYCVPASLEMILTFYGMNITQDEIAGHIFDFTGSKLSTTVNYLESIGYECRYFIGKKEHYQTLLAKNIPVLLSVDFEHSSHVQLMTGYDSRFDFYHIQDPNMLETIYLSSEDLEKVNVATSYMSIVCVPKERAAELAFLSTEENQYFRTINYLGEKLEEEEDQYKELFFQFLKENLDVPYTAIYVVKHFSFEEYSDFILQCIEKLLELYPNNDFMNLHIAQAYMRLQKMEQSREQLKHTVRKTFSPLYHFLNGRIALYFSEMQEAINYFRKSLQIDYDQYYTWSYLALSYLYNEDINKAEYYSMISMELAPKDRFVRINHAAVLIEKEEYEEARQIYNRLIRDEPADGHAWYERARLDQRLGKLRKAMRGYLLSIKLDNHVPYSYLAAADLYEYEFEQPLLAEELLLSGLDSANSPQLYVRLGEYYREYDDTTAASHYFQTCIELFPDERFAYIGLAEMIINKEEAVEFIKNHLPRFEDDSEYLINSGELLAKWAKEKDSVPLLEEGLQLVEEGISKIQGNLTEALEHYVRMVEESSLIDRAINFLGLKFAENPHLIEYACYQGSLYEEQLQFSFAIECYQSALKVRENAYSYYRLGEVYFKIGQYGLAADAFKQCIGLDKQIESALERLAEIAGIEGKHEDEAEYLLSILELSPLSVNIEYLASILDEEGLNQLLNKLQFLEGADSKIWQLDAVSYVYGALGRISEEEEYLASALAIEPDHPELIHHQMKLFIKTKNWERTDAILEILLNKYPDDEGIYQSLIFYTAEANKWSSLPAFLHALKGKKEVKSSRFLLSAEAGQQYISKINWTDIGEGNVFSRFVRKLKNRTKQISIFGSIIELYELAIKLDNSNLAAVSRFAKFYENFDLAEEAIKILQKILKQHWDDRIAYQLAMNFLTIENYQSALPLFERQLNSDRSDTHLQYLTALCMCELGDTEEAEERIKRIIDVNPFESNAHSRLGQLYNAQGRYLEAKELLENALVYHPYDSDIRIGLGLTLRQLNEVEKALEINNFVLQFESDNLLAHYNKACYLALLSRVEEAKRVLEFVFEHDLEGYFQNLAESDKDLENLKVVSK